jgi:hypothetical protein
MMRSIPTLQVHPAKVVPLGALELSLHAAGGRAHLSATGGSWSSTPACCRVSSSTAALFALADSCSGMAAGPRPPQCFGSVSTTLRRKVKRSYQRIYVTASVGRLRSDDEPRSWQLILGRWQAARLLFGSSSQRGAGCVTIAEPHCTAVVQCSADDSPEHMQLLKQSLLLLSCYHARRLSSLMPSRHMLYPKGSRLSGL